MSSIILFVLTCRLGDDANTFWKALHNLPTHVSDSLKMLIAVIPEKKTIPPVNVLSHVTICVSDLGKSLPFYEAFGLAKHGMAEGNQQFLSLNSSQNKWSTLVLLKEDKTLKPRGDAHAAGMTRLCIYSKNHYKEVEHLASLGFKPIAPTCVDKTGGLFLNIYETAFKDPDGFVVYLIEFTKLVGFAVKLINWKRKVQAPSLFHWTINVKADIKKVMSGFEKLGFLTVSDKDSSQVVKCLLSAFNIDPTTTEIEHIRMCHLPEDTFLSTLMQWNM